LKIAAMPTKFMVKIQRTKSITIQNAERLIGKTLLRMKEGNLYIGDLNNENKEIC
jgi:hypothetical protein